MYYWMVTHPVVTSFCTWNPNFICCLDRDATLHYMGVWIGQLTEHPWDSLNPVRLVWAPVWLAQLVDEDIWMAPLSSNCPNLELSSHLVVLKWPLIRTDSRIANCSSSLCTILYKDISWAISWATKIHTIFRMARDRMEMCLAISFPSKIDERLKINRILF